MLSSTMISGLGRNDVVTGCDLSPSGNGFAHVLDCVVVWTGMGLARGRGEEARPWRRAGLKRQAHRPGRERQAGGV